jgi:hypothetical protein
MQIHELVWLMKHTVPVPGERGAALESWRNALSDAGMMPADRDRAIEEAQSIWRDHPWRHTDGQLALAGTIDTDTPRRRRRFER